MEVLLYNSSKLPELQPVTVFIVKNNIGVVMPSISKIHTAAHTTQQREKLGIWQGSFIFVLLIHVLVPFTDFDPIFIKQLMIALA